MVKIVEMVIVVIMTMMMIATITIIVRNDTLKEAHDIVTSFLGSSL